MLFKTARQKARALAVGSMPICLIGTVVGLAPATQAATVNVTVDCLNAEAPITAAQGDTVVITAGSACLPTADWFAIPGAAYTWSDYFANPISYTGPTYSYIIQPNAPLGTMPFATNTLPYVCKSSCTPYAQLRFTITAASSGGEGSSTSPNMSIWQKAVGKTAAMAYCPEGWGDSWQEWAIPVTGGPVCVAEYYAYSPSTPLPGRTLPAAFG